MFNYGLLSDYTIPIDIKRIHQSDESIVAIDEITALNI
jgi:hypothetical protein